MFLRFSADDPQLCSVRTGNLLEWEGPDQEKITVFQNARKCEPLVLASLSTINSTFNIDIDNYTSLMS